MWPDICLVLVLAIPIVVAVVLAVFRRVFVRAAGAIAAGAAVLSLCAAIVLMPELSAGRSPAVALGVRPMPGVDLSLRLDWVSLPFLLTEIVVTLLAVVYGWGYHRPRANTPLFYALLLVFGAGMSGTTIADDTVLFYTFWELMLVASVALILVWGDEPPGGPRRQAVAFKYAIFTHLGSLMVLVALLILHDAAGHDSFSVLRQGVTLSPGLTKTLITLFLLGFGVKMAVFPLHIWLPDAHTVAPMPVTIMLAAAMLSMGIYGILRFPMSMFPIESLAPFSAPMMVVGVISEIYGALMALAERDVKRIIAYSSVSQMGYILFGLGTLNADGIVGGTLHVIYHAIVKALLFAVVGIIIHTTRRRRLEQLGGLGRLLPVTAACAAVGILAISGVPLLCVFVSEWMIFAGGFHTGRVALSIASLFGSLLTVAYALWFGSQVFLGIQREEVEMLRAPRAMVVPTVVLAVLAIAAGLFPGPVIGWVSKELSILLGGIG